MYVVFQIDKEPIKLYGFGDMLEYLNTITLSSNYMIIGNIKSNGYYIANGRIIIDLDNTNLFYGEYKNNSLYIISSAISYIRTYRIKTILACT